LLLDCLLRHSSPTPASPRATDDQGEMEKIRKMNNLTPTTTSRLRKMDEQQRVNHLVHLSKNIHQHFSQLNDDTLRYSIDSDDLRMLAKEEQEEGKEEEAVTGESMGLIEEHKADDDSGEHNSLNQSLKVGDFEEKKQGDVDREEESSEDDSSVHIDSDDDAPLEDFAEMYGNSLKSLGDDEEESSPDDSPLSRGSDDDASASSKVEDDGLVEMREDLLESLEVTSTTSKLEAKVEELVEMGINYFKSFEDAQKQIFLWKLRRSEIGAEHERALQSR